MRRLLVVLGAVVLLVLGVLYAAGTGWLGSHEGPGEPTAVARPAAAVAATRAAVRAASSGIGVPQPKQVLFGDLHVHTTFSPDAFLISLPLGGGEGAHPPADACDFARYCSALDFWSINDHAEGSTPRHWNETVEAIRQCNAVAGDADDPDTVAYLGWEWTQVGATPESHYGHKNVVVRDTGEGRIPTRPIAAGGRARALLGTRANPLALGFYAIGAGGGRLLDFATYGAERLDVPECERGVPVRELPANCREYADDPAELFAKLDDWGFESMVIPHGTTWGFYTPPGSTWSKQLAGAMHDPERQTLIEVYSGHGDSEVYRTWRGVELAADGTATCPEPTPDYLPSCWRAGEIIRDRCLAEGEDEAECDERARATRERAVAAGVAGHLVVPGESAADWLDAGQCTDCREPSFNYRPGGSAQYILALGSFDRPEPRHFRMGFMASSDNHYARPGTGYKEVHRRGMTESRGQLPREGAAARFVAAPREDPLAESRVFDPGNTSLQAFQLLEIERQASYFLTGGLIGVHSEGRDRQSVWDAMARREVYGTSGPRILLWFDLLDPPGSRGRTAPMGTEVELARNPIFQVRAVGSFAQEPGCPDHATQALGPERIAAICKGECYNPSDRRRNLTRIEVVRVRPQQGPDEDVAGLIEDPWRVFECAPDPAGCAVTFEDPDYTRDGRDTVYYVRAFEEEKPGINAGGVRCSRDEAGRCTEVDLCGDDPADDCLAPHEPRAWSSPIWVDWPRAPRP